MRHAFTVEVRVALVPPSLVSEDCHQCRLARRLERVEDPWQVEAQVCVAVQHGETSAARPCVVREAKRTAGTAKVRPLVDIRDGQTPARAVTDVFADLVAAVRDAVHDLLDALLREPRQLMVGERAACNGYE